MNLKKRKQHVENITIMQLKSGIIYHKKAQDRKWSRNYCCVCICDLKYCKEIYDALMYLFSIATKIIFQRRCTRLTHVNTVHYLFENRRMMLEKVYMCERVRQFFRFLLICENVLIQFFYCNILLSYQPRHE